MTLFPFPFQPDDPQLTDAATGQPRAELVAAWGLAEVALVGPDDRTRLEALQALAGSDDYRFSPVTCLVAFWLLQDNSVQLRAAAVQVLAATLERVDGQWVAPSSTRQHVAELLKSLRPDEVMRLAALAFDVPDARTGVCALLDRVTGLGETLSAVVADRGAEHRLRLLALELLRTMGRVDALPALEQFERRLLGLRLGQLNLNMALQSNPDAVALLKELHATITYLREDE